MSLHDIRLIIVNPKNPISYFLHCIELQNPNYPNLIFLYLNQ
jgi:hypothetical protein